jgi:hypothetical protein
MTPAEAEATFIELWNAGLETAVIAQRLGITATAAQSRARRLQQRGLIEARPRGGPYPSLRAKARPEDPPATPAPPTAERKDIQQWTVRLSKALIDHLKVVAYERRIPPSQLGEDLVWKALTDHQLSTPSESSIGNFLGINDQREIVGFSDDGGFLLSKGVFTPIDVPDSTGTAAFGINKYGDIVGSYTDANTRQGRGFVRSKGTFTPIDVPESFGAVSTAATASMPSGRSWASTRSPITPNTAFLPPP